MKNRMVKAEPHRKECAARSVRVSYRLTASPNFSHLLVTKRRKGRPDKARDRGPRKRTLCSTLRRPTERNAVMTDGFVAAVENL